MSSVYKRSNDDDTRHANTEDAPNDFLVITISIHFRIRTLRLNVTR